MAFAFVAKRRHIRPVSRTGEVQGVSRPGFPAWLKRPIGARASDDARLAMEIDKSFKARDRTHRARRVWRDVLEDGVACGLHRIERLMRQTAMSARPRRRGKPEDDGEGSVIADNIPRSGFPARAAEPEVAGRPHLHPDRRGPALHLGRAAPVLPSRRRVVDEGGQGYFTGHGRADDGRLAPRQSGCVTPTFGQQVCACRRARAPASGTPPRFLPNSMQPLPGGGPEAIQ